jgi:hypothetical protein
VYITSPATAIQSIKSGSEGDGKSYLDLSELGPSSLMLSSVSD